MNDYKELIEMLRDMSRAIIRDDSIELGIAEELITDVDADACNDAADAIEQLVRERGKLKLDLCEANDVIEFANDKLKRVERERDAAINDLVAVCTLYNVANICNTCKYSNFEDCGNMCKYEWRGVQE